MTVIQEVLLELEKNYLGHPYFVSGHALYSAVARRVPDRVARALSVSTGMFVPGEYGSYPDWHSRPGSVPYLGTGLHPVEAYEDLFLFRDAAQRWLSDTRPRDVHNTHELREYGNVTAYRPARSVGLPEPRRASKRTMSWYVHWYLHGEAGDCGDVVPLDEEVLDGLRLGGVRNYGFGATRVEDTQVVDLSTLDYSRLEAADDHWLEVVSPFVLASEYPGADSRNVPWWWGWDGSVEAGADADVPPRMQDESALRRRTTRLVKGDDVYEVATVDHGQVVGYAGDRPVETARNGLRGVGTHAQYGFGELRVWPAGDDRVSERAIASKQGRGESS